jgi:hypothetical protein
LTKIFYQPKLSIALDMKRFNWFSVLVMMMALLATAACLPTATAPPTASAGSTADASTAIPGTEPASNPAVPPEVPLGDNTISSDPVSGQSEEVDLRWEELCMSSEYQVQIAKDPSFTIIVVDTGSFGPADSGSPGAYYPAGGRSPSPSSLTSWANLEAGHTYYWRARVRQAASGQRMLSPWSEVSSFTVKSGTPASTGSYGVQPIYPGNGQVACPVTSASFSWSPMADTTRYRFVLSKDAGMTQVVVNDIVGTTAYNYPGQLEYDQAYFWRVMALEPVPGDWSATFSFHTETAPPPAAAATPSTMPVWAWAIVVIGLILLAVIIVLIFLMRHR